MTLTPDTRLVPRPDAAAREIDDWAVLVNMASGACFELNGIGFEIWKGLGPGATMGGICEAFAGRYSLQREVLAADVGRLAEALFGEGLVKSARRADKLRAIELSTCVR